MLLEKPVASATVVWLLATGTWVQILPVHMKAVEIVKLWRCTTWKQALRLTLAMPTKLAYWAGPICLHLARIPLNTSYPYICPIVF